VSSCLQQAAARMCLICIDMHQYGVCMLLQRLAACAAIAAEELSSAKGVERSAP
jgi:hypothetical protein